MEHVGCNDTASCVSARYVVHGYHLMFRGGQCISNQDWDNTETRPVLSGVVSVPTRYTWQKVLVGTGPSVRDGVIPPDGFSKRIPLGVGWDAPQSRAVEGGSVDALVMAALFAGWAKIEP